MTETIIGFLKYNFHTMGLKNCSTALFVKDIETSKKFYSDILGLTISLDFGKNVIYSGGFTIWEIRDDHIITELLGRENITGNRATNSEIYFETDDIHRMDEILKKSNVRFLHGMHEEPWGQITVRFFDPDDHLIEIGESMKLFIQRFYDQGMTVKEINRKTSVPVDEIIRILNI